MIAKKLSHVVARKIDDEAVLVPVRTDTATPLTIHALGPVGAFVWEALDGARNTTVIADMVCEEFEVDAERARDDLRAFVAELAAAGLVEVV